MTYRVEVTLGPYSWTINKGDAPRWPLSDVLDGLSVSWQMPPTDQWPAQPDPTTASLSLLTKGADDLDDLDIGSLARILIYAGAINPATGLEVPAVGFVGRVSDLRGRPTRVPVPDGSPALADLGWIIDVTCVDLMADLADVNVAGSVDPLDTGGAQGWVLYYFDLAGITPPDWGFGGNGRLMVTPDSGEIPSAPLLQAVDDVLRHLADGGPIVGDESVPENHALYEATGWNRGVLMPKFADDPSGPMGVGFDQDPVTPWAVEWVSKCNFRQSVLNPTNPFRLIRVTATQWQLLTLPPPAVTYDVDTAEWLPVNDFTWALHADYVSFDATWTRNKLQRPTRAVVTTDETPPDTNWRKVTRTAPLQPGEQHVVTQVPGSRLVERYAAQQTGDMYVARGNYDRGNRWTADGFTYHASRDPSWPRLGTIFPNLLSGPLPFIGFSAPVLIDWIPQDILPIPSSRHYVGTLMGATWRFSGGEFDILLTLQPRSPSPPGDFLSDAAFCPPDFNKIADRGALPGDRGPAVARPRYRDLVKSDSYADFRLVRPADTDYPAADPTP